MSLDNEKTVPLAIVGIGCMFPGAEDSTRYWSNIKHGRDGISEIPESHWDAEDYFDKDPKRPDFTYAKTGGFLKPFDFNPLDYGIPPNAIEATDTAQLLGLVAAQQALIDAGYDPKNDWDKSRVSVVLGVTGALELVIPLGARLGHPKWRRALEEAGVDTETANDVIERISDSYVGWQEASFPGLLGNVVAGRIANRLDLGGTNCVVDAACASSLSALHLASLELISGRSSMAIAGGVDTFNDIFMYMCFSKTPALSPTGHSRPFDAQGDGTILGEGVGMVVLKRLEDAKRDGDRIYSILRGVGSSSDGKGQAIYAPSSEGQARALQNAYEIAGVSPETVELVEAHGTGTKVGDDVELTALTKVYSADSEGRDGERARWCAIGSVKSQIGHTKAAAGVAGLIKASLALHHKVLPPSIKVSAPLPALAKESSPFYLNTLPRPWLGNKEHPRRAALSALGFGGSNFHCVLEESDSQSSQVDWTGDSQILAFSGQSRDAVRAAVADFPKTPSLNNLRILAAQSRERFTHTDPIRLLLPLQFSDDAVEGALAKGLTLLASSKGEGLHSTPDGFVLADNVAGGDVAVLFPGQGSQYLGMLRDLACQFPAMLEVLVEAEAVFAHGSRSDGLSDLVYPRWAFADTETKAKQVASLTDTAVAQPAIGAVSLGAYRILQDFGLKASLFAGHSYGELTALCAGQRLGSKDFHGLSRARGELMAAGDGDRGSMLAVKADVKTVEKFLKESELNLVLANKNSPNQCVLSGATADVKKAVNLLKGQKLRCTELKVAAAFHSSFVSDAAKPLGEALSKVKIQEGVGTVFANTIGAPYPKDAGASKDLLANQLAKPVEFVNEIEAMYDAGARIFIEIGPGNRLTGLAKSILGDKAYFARALDSSGGRHHGVLDLARAIAWLAALGLEMDLKLWDNGSTLLSKAPKSKKKALMTVALTGSNYRSPTKKKAPRAPKAKTQAQPTPQFSATSRPVSAAKSSTNGQAHRVKPTASLSRNKTVTPRKQEVTSMTSPIGNPNQLSEALRITQENIAALQRIQEQNAQLHERFMEGQENAQQTFHLLFQQQQQLLLGTLGQGSQSTSVPPVTQVSPGPMTTRATPRRNGTTAPKAAPIAPNRVAKPSAPQPAPVAPKPSPAPEKPASAGTSQTKISALLLAVVAEKTGYPAEMLELEMGLDSDLGIDSIKRVEILSALQEQLPEIPSIKSDEMGSIQTLKDIVDVLAKAAPSGASPSSRNGAQVKSAPKTSGAVGSTKISALLLAVVAEKTGYPAEMLELEMGLDSDLGIDSIKRVEILSALQEQLPEIASIKSDEMGSIQTLKDIVDVLAKAAPTAAEAPEPTNTGTVNKTEISALLLAVVAEKTGYPAEMLELEMGLDSDLGIDSIKRVEILSAIQEQMPEAPTIQSDQMGSIQTLKDIVELLAQVVGSISEASADVEPELAESVPQKKNDPEESLDRFELGMELFASSDRSPLTVRPGVVYITDDGSELPKKIAQNITDRGLEAVVGPVKTDLDIENLSGLILLSPTGYLADDYPFSNLELTQKAAKKLRRGQTFLVSVSRMDGAFGLKSWSEDQCPFTATIGALVKTADKEWKKVSCKSLDLASNSNNVDRAAKAIVEECLTVGPLEVGLGIGDERRIPVLRSAPIDSELKNGALKSDDVIIVTGGARGVTAATAIALAESSEAGATFVLVGRSAVPGAEESWLAGLTSDADIKKGLMERGERSPKVIQEKCRRILADREIRQTVLSIEAAGMKVEYASVDARDKDAVLHFVDKLSSDYGDPTGLIHGAGVLADRLIEDKTLDQFDRVFGTKVHGFENFLEALRGLPLRHMVLFSSSTGRLGRKGQVDYAMANEVLNKYAQKLSARSHQLKALALNWGPWAGGMVTPNLRKIFEKEGVALIPQDAGAEFMVREMFSVESRAVEQVILGSGSKINSPKPKPNPLTLAFERVLAVESHSFLKSHVLDGRAVLPMAIVIEWLSHGALHGQPGLAFAGFDDLRILKGLVIDETESVTLQVLAGKAQKDGKDFLISTELRSQRGEIETLHARALIRLSASLPKYDATRELNVSGQPYALSKTEIYENVLFHGPDFQCIESVSATAREGMIARASTAPAPSKWLEKPLRGTWISDPLALDSAFQLMILWSVEYHEAPSLPCAIGSYRQFKRSFPKDGVELRIAITRESSHQAKADIEFVDSKGLVVARIDNFECVMDASLKKAFRLKQLVSEQQSGDQLS